MTMNVNECLADPFLMRSADGEDFVGFIPDLLKLLSRMLVFQYEIRLVRDGKYGRHLPDGRWNGMIGELTRREADIAAAPLTVTSMRMRVVDLTMPYATGQIAAIMKNRHARQLEIHSVTDLARQSTMKYGVIASSATEEYFRNSRYPHYERMWAQMFRDGNSSRVQTVVEGIRRVRASTDEHPWALLADSALLTSSRVRQCDLVVVGSGISRYQALAVPLGSPYYERLSLAAFQLAEDGTVDRLRYKWFQSLNCDHSAKRFLLSLH